MSELIIGRVNTEYTIEVLDSDGILQFNDAFYCESQAKEVGAQWLQVVEAANEYKSACGAIDRARTEAWAEECRIHAQSKHDAVYTLGLDLSIIDMSL